VCVISGVDFSRSFRGWDNLRHFYASWCINRRADGGLELPLKVVQARLGHASIQMTADRFASAHHRRGAAGDRQD
jgi:integrase